MPGSIDIKVDISEFDGYLSAIADPGQVRKITRKALRKGAAVTKAAVEERAPVRPDLPSGSALPVGALKSDIVIRSFTGSDGNEHASVQPGAQTMRVASWVEYGHQMVHGGRLSKKGKGRGKNVGFVPAHPFFRPAVEASEQAAAEAIADSLSEDAVNPTATGSEAA